MVEAWSESSFQNQMECCRKVGWAPWKSRKMACSKGGISQYNMGIKAPTNICKSQMQKPSYICYVMSAWPGMSGRSRDRPTGSWARKAVVDMMLKSSELKNEARLLDQYDGNSQCKDRSVAKD